MSIVTHTGGCHADDVVGVAIASLAYPGIEITRSRDPQVIGEALVVVDVGMKYDPETLRFDHHQQQRHELCRENGLPYAAAGLTWKHLGRKAILQTKVRTRRVPSFEIDAVWDWIDRHFIEAIDRVDCGDYLGIASGSFQVSFGDYLRSFAPPWYGDRGKDAADAGFFEAVDRAKEHLERLIRDRIFAAKAAAKVAEAFVAAQGAEFIVLSTNIPWHEHVLALPGIKYVIHPQSKGTWGAESVRMDWVTEASKHDPDQCRPRFPFPWAGLVGEELQKESGVPGLTFCHREGHLLIGDSQEAIVQGVEKAIEHYRLKTAVAES